VNMLLAAAQLGDTAAAQEALERLLALKPDYPDMVRADLRSFSPVGANFPPDLMARVAEGLRKAGLVVADPTSAD